MRGGAAVRWRLVVAHAFPDVENEEVAVEGEAFEGDITGGEDIAAAGLGVGQAVFGRGDDLLWGTGLAWRRSGRYRRGRPYCRTGA